MPTDPNPYEQQARETYERILNAEKADIGGAGFGKDAGIRELASALLAVAQERDAQPCQDCGGRRECSQCGDTAVRNAIRYGETVERDAEERRALEAEVAALRDVVASLHRHNDISGDDLQCPGVEGCSLRRALANTAHLAAQFRERIAQEAAEKWAAEIAHEGCNDRGCYKDDHSRQCPVGIAAWLRSAWRSACVGG